ncbi:PAS domain-containing sensor histidine kinase [Paenibacillus antarcticus]|uniref:histidine kinase n=1 Tax=Paenibacillus antarcticus TaxID=253703 RepID=A0A168MPP5_9BACL|nr:PAS domain-containing sensor histidine kinase [Paenibacillus antarcticus]
MKVDTMKFDLIIRESNQRCIDLGIRSDLQPRVKRCLSAKELEIEINNYCEVLEVINYFVDKFLASTSGDPYLIAISNDEGYILSFRGDTTMIDAASKFGIIEGIQANEDLGTNAIGLCLRYGQPIELIGKDHYHTVLQDMVCCASPIYGDGGKRIVGTLSLMTVKEYSHPSLLALISTLADSIEREILLRRQNTEHHILNQVLLETNYYGVVVTDAFGRVVELNENILRMLNWDDQDKERYLYSSICEVSLIGDFFQDVIDKGKAYVGVELALQVTGAIRYYMLDVVPIYDHQILIRIVGTLRNITEMKKTEVLLRNTEKLVYAGEVAVSIAHEIRNPLTTIKGMIQLSGKDSKLLHYDLIMSELERMNVIISDFMILGKPKEVRFSEEYSSTIIREVLSIFQIHADINGISIVSEIIQDEQVKCDRNQLKQVFLNILRNAMEALPLGGEIYISLDIEGSFQRIRIADNGEGMTPEVLSRIGKPFYTTKSDGNGLGMMIVNNIVASHHGRVNITSEIDKGTTVAILLPIR